MAKGFLSRGVRIVATGVVLLTAPQSAKWVAAPTFRSGPPPQLMLWISRGLSWGSSQGRANTTEPYPRSLRGRFQSGYGNASYAGLSSPALQTPTPPYVGIQPGRTTRYLAFPQHDARGDVQIVLRTPNRVSGHYRGHESELRPSRCPSK